MITNSYHFEVVALHGAPTKSRVYFSRVVSNVDDAFDVGLVLDALKLLFRSDMFKISVVTYGA